ncbi:MAG: hypothetical protein AAF517_12600 [Planctomycetota bacterium]
MFGFLAITASLGLGELSLEMVGVELPGALLQGSHLAFRFLDASLVALDLSAEKDASNRNGRVDEFSSSFDHLPLVGEVLESFFVFLFFCVRHLSLELAHVVLVFASRAIRFEFEGVQFEFVKVPTQLAGLVFASAFLGVLEFLLDRLMLAVDLLELVVRLAFVFFVSCAPDLFFVLVALAVVFFVAVAPFAIFVAVFFAFEEAFDLL